MNKHHEHELSEHPEVQWALNLLKPDENYESGFLKTYTSEMCCIGLGVGSVCFGNYLSQRPFYSGIYKHIAAVAIGYAASQMVNKYIDANKAEHDTNLRDYIIRHPEFFPEPERIKFGQILEPWLPVR